MMKSLRGRLTLLFIFLSVLPVILVAVILTRNSFSVLEEEAIKNQQQIAEHTTSEVLIFIQTREAELRQLNEVNGLVSVSSEEQENFMRNLLSNQRAYQQLLLLDARGEEVIHLSRQELITEDMFTTHADEPEFTVPVETLETYFSEVYFDPSSREPLLTIAIPLINLRTGKAEYILIGELRFRIIWDLIAEIDQGLPSQNDEVYITNANGRIVAHRNPSVVLSNKTVALNENAGRARGLDGTDVFISSQNLRYGNKTLVILAERPVAEALKLATDGIRVAVIVTLVTLVFAVSIGTFTVGRVLHPIEELSATAETIREGNLSARVAVRSQDEIGRLAISFNTMTEKLNDSIINLEKRVDERTQELQSAREEAESASRLKSQFLANMSHELRTPLNAIFNFTAFVADEVMGPVNEEQHEALQQTLDSSHHLLSLINDVLDLTKIEAGMMELFIEEVNMSALLMSSVSVGKGLVKDKPIEMIVSIDKNLPITYGDRRRLRQVFLNVVSNAVKYTRQGQIELSAKQEDTGIHITVKDTGIGIHADDQYLVFESFKQAKHELTKAVGTGLGLPISKFFVESHKGKIWFESVEESGTTFHIFLPTLTKDEAEVANKQVAQQTL